MSHVKIVFDPDLNISLETFIKQWNATYADQYGMITLTQYKSPTMDPMSADMVIGLFAGVGLSTVARAVSNFLKGTQDVETQHTIHTNDVQIIYIEGNDNIVGDGNYKSTTYT